MHKLIFILACCFFYTVASPAQTKKYVYEDSTLEQTETPPEEEPINTEKPYEQVLKEQQQDDGKTDTTLIFNKLSIPADSIESWKNSKAFGYAKNLDSLLMERKKKEEIKFDRPVSSGPSFFDKLFASPVTRVIFWILAAVFVLFIIYRLFLADGIFKKASTVKDNVAPVVEEEVITAETDFDNLIRSALAARNYRLAVRYQYLKALHLLSAKGWIQLAADKTNYQYVREIKNFDYQNSFSKLTLNYEYVWYGEFAIEEFIYLRLQNEFTDFNKKM